MPSEAQGKRTLKSTGKGFNQTGLMDPKNRSTGNYFKQQRKPLAMPALVVTLNAVME